MTYKITLIGAGSANFGLGTLGDFLKSKVLSGSTIALHDINEESLQKVAKIGERYIQEQRLPYTLQATTNLPEALEGADFCIISIEVGNRFELWEQDWKIPLQFGIRQVYGENGGPGGLFHALRIIPPILNICEQISQICPQAYVFNFSNPMSRICTTVKRKYPQLRFIGLCHEVASLPKHLPRILNTPLSNLKFRAGGLNHFSVLTSITYRDTGKDAYPDVLSKAPAYFESLAETYEWANIEPNSPLRQSIQQRAVWVERQLFKVILEVFGCLPITTDSHFGEYIPWAYEVVDQRGILDFFRVYQHWCAQQFNPQRIQGTNEDWMILPIIEGIITDAGYEEAAVNLLNDGFIENLPHDIAVEVPAIIDKNGVHGIPLGKLPKGIGGLLNNQYAVHDLTAEAVLQQSKHLALQALCVDPLVNTLRGAQKALETIIDYQKPYLGYLK